MKSYFPWVIDEQIGYFTPALGRVGYHGQAGPLKSAVKLLMDV